MAVQNEATKVMPRANGNRWKTKGNSAPKSDNQDDQAKQHVGYLLIDLRRNFWLSSSKDCDWKSQKQKQRDSSAGASHTQQSADHRNRRTTEWTECQSVAPSKITDVCTRWWWRRPQRSSAFVRPFRLPASSSFTFAMSSRGNDVNEGPEQNIYGEKGILES